MNRIANTAVFLFGIATLAHGDLITLTPSNVIGGSPVLYGEWNSTLGGPNIFASQATGSEIDLSGYNWISSGDGPGFIVIDLGAEYNIDSIDLYQAFDGGYYGHGTGEFEVLGGNSITNDGSDGEALTGTTTLIASGTMTAATVTAQPGPYPVDAQDYTADSGTEVEYLEFEALSAVCPGGSCNSSTGYGLSEMLVYGDEADATPEPATCVLLTSGLAASVWWNSRRKRFGARTSAA